MTKIFIDTNIFVGLYQSNQNAVDAFKDIFKLKSNLILTDQVYDEFIRNRDGQLQTIIKTLNSIKYPSSSPTIHLKEFFNLKEANESLIKKLQEADTDRDQFYNLFLELYNDSEITKYERNEEIIKKAYNRKLIGNPPVSDKLTIGDEVNWEIILSNLKDDLVIVTKDGTYNKHITFLKNEFKLRTNKELFIEEKISSALKKIGEISSDELNELEKEPKEKLSISDASENRPQIFMVTPDSSGNILKRTQTLFGGTECPRCGFIGMGARCKNCGYCLGCD